MVVHTTTILPQSISARWSNACTFNACVSHLFPPETQGMNYLAGFILITFADCVLSEREDLKSRSSRNRATSGGSSTCSSNAPVDSAAAGDVTEPSDVQPGPAKEGSAAVETEGRGGGAEKEAAVKEPTVAEVAQIENECVQMLQGVIALQGGVLSRDLWGLHAVSGGGGGHMVTRCSSVGVLFSGPFLDRMSTAVNGGRHSGRAALGRVCAFTNSVNLRISD